MDSLIVNSASQENFYFAELKERKNILYEFDERVIFLSKFQT